MIREDPHPGETTREYWEVSHHWIFTFPSCAFLEPDIICSVIPLPLSYWVSIEISLQCQKQPLINIFYGQVEMELCYKLQTLPWIFAVMVKIAEFFKHLLWPHGIFWWLVYIYPFYPMCRLVRLIFYSYRSKSTKNWSICHGSSDCKRSITWLWWVTCYTAMCNQFMSNNSCYSTNKPPNTMLSHCGGSLANHFH